MIAEIVAVLAKHHLTFSSGVFRCSCLEQIYPGRDRRAAVGNHDIHVAQQLKAAGFTLAPKDPREAFIARQNGRTQP